MHEFRALPAQVVAYGAVHTDALCEWIIGCVVVAGITWGGLASWHFYDTALRPYARTAPVVSAPRVAHLSNPDEVRRLQRTTELLGEATSYVEAKRWEWAKSAVAQALALDPDYPEARELLRRISTESPLALTPQEQATRDRDDRVVELLGAATSEETAGRSDLARAHLEQAITLDPASPIVRSAIEHLEAQE